MAYGRVSVCVCVCVCVRAHACLCLLAARVIVYLNVQCCVSTLLFSLLFVIARLELFLFCDGISAPYKYSYYYYYYYY